MIVIISSILTLIRSDQPLDKVVVPSDSDGCPIEPTQRMRMMLLDHGKNFTGFDGLPEMFQSWQFGFPTGTLMNDLVPTHLRLGRFSLAEALFSLPWDCWADADPDRFWDYVMSLYGNIIDGSWESNFVSMTHLVRISFYGFIHVIQHIRASALAYNYVIYIVVHIYAYVNN